MLADAARYLSPTHRRADAPAEACTDLWTRPGPSRHRLKMQMPGSLASESRAAPGGSINHQRHVRKPGTRSTRAKAGNSPRAKKSAAPNNSGQAIQRFRFAFKRVQRRPPNGSELVLIIMECIRGNLSDPSDLHTPM